MLKALHFTFISLWLSNSFASLANYNNVLIGEAAAGLGGAFTAMLGDASASPFYNPATLARMEGTSLSAATTVFHKYDTNYGATSFSDSFGRINRGFFNSIPSSSGSVLNYGPFSVGLSIIVPYYDKYSGEVESSTSGSDSSNTYIAMRDESLWTGLSFGLNLTTKQSAGLTIYYTSRSYEKYLKSEQVASGTTKLLTEEKSLTQNSFIYILGYYYQFSKYFSLGLSHRFRSIPLSGEGQYITSLLDTSSSPTPSNSVAQSGIQAKTQYPSKSSIGLVYAKKGAYTYSLDFSYYGAENYNDLNGITGGEQVIHKKTWNIALGVEMFLNYWLKARVGFYTNHSSHPEITNANERQKDHINMYGFSANMSFYPRQNISFTVGGYYTGGKGKSVEYSGSTLTVLDKTQQLFALLVGTSYLF